MISTFICPYNKKIQSDFCMYMPTDTKIHPHESFKSEQSSKSDPHKFINDSRVSQLNLDWDLNYHLLYLKLFKNLYDLYLDCWNWKQCLIVWDSAVREGIFWSGSVTICTKSHIQPVSLNFYAAVILRKFLLFWCPSFTILIFVSIWLGLSVFKFS